MNGASGDIRTSPYEYGLWPLVIINTVIFGPTLSSRTSQVVNLLTNVILDP